MIQAKVIADSINKHGDRVTTLIGVFPRYILAEFNTHRMISKNSASSRALRFEKLVEQVEANPFVPMAWMKDHTGMQGNEYFTDGGTLTSLNQDWLGARDRAVLRAKSLSAIGLTKQLVNRLIEPFMWHTVIFTATEWENFFHLRCPQYNEPNKTIHRSKKDLTKKSLGLDWAEMNKWTTVDWLQINSGMADIHMMAFAECVWDSVNESQPRMLDTGEWHIPFSITEQDGSDFWNLPIDLRIKVATSRCARVSYLNYDSTKTTVEQEIALHDRLASSGHWSAFEHCARAMNDDEYNRDYTSGNFTGFVQYRKLFANENVTKK